jgi:hypothetical protein
MEKSNKRGKIPQADWPLIMARYDAGETLASIARTYDCSPPAISYVVSRNRDKPANEASPPPALEPQLLKAHPNGSSVNSPIAAVEPKIAPAAVPAAAAPFAGAPPHRNDAERAPAPVMPAPGPAQRGNGEQQRPKLHLGFGNGNGHGNGHSPDNGGQQPQAQPAPQPFQAPPRDNPFGNGPSNRDFAAMREPRPPSQMAPQVPRDEAPARKNGGAALDQELRSRVDGDITAFLAAFDAVLAADSQESRFGLKEATDRLLRAGARTRIELERLEAKVPLPPRDSGGHAEPVGWRYR